MISAWGIDHGYDEISKADNGGLISYLYQGGDASERIHNRANNIWHKRPGVKNPMKQALRESPWKDRDRANASFAGSMGGYTGKKGKRAVAATKEIAGAGIGGGAGVATGMGVGSALTRGRGVAAPLIGGTAGGIAGMEGGYRLAYKHNKRKGHYMKPVKPPKRNS